MHLTLYIGIVQSSALVKQMLQLPCSRRWSFHPGPQDQRAQSDARYTALLLSVPVSCTVNTRQEAGSWSYSRHVVESTIDINTCNMHEQLKSGHTKKLNENTSRKSAAIRPASCNRTCAVLSYPSVVVHSLCGHSLKSQVVLVASDSFLCPRDWSIPTVCQEGSIIQSVLSVALS